MGQSLSNMQTAMSPKGRIINEHVGEIREAYIKRFQKEPLWSLTDKAASSTPTSTGPPRAAEVVGTGSRPGRAMTPIEKFLETDGAFDIDSVPATDYIDLENVHPIFALSNFDTTLLGKQQMQKAWTVFRPALSLATKMIMAPEARRGFWHRVLFGRVTVDPTTRKRVLAPSPEENDFKAASRTFDLLLTDLAKELTLCVHGKIPDMGAAAPSRDSMLHYVVPTVAKSIRSRLRVRSDPLTVEYLKSFCPFLAISADLFEHALDPSSPIHAGSDSWHVANLNFQFLLADLLTHELAHLVWYMRQRGRDDFPLWCEAEPFTFLDDEIPEVGYAWNVWCVGSIIDDHAEMLRSETLRMLEATSWQQLNKFPSVRAVVDLRWVQRWFLKETWAEGKRGEKRRKSTLWGSVPSTSSSNVPKYFVADSVRINGSEKYVERTLYVYGRPRATEKTKRFFVGVKEIDRHILGPGRSHVETWYRAFFDAMKTYVGSQGFDTNSWGGGWGDYEYKRATAHGAPKRDFGTMEGESKDQGGSSHQNKSLEDADEPLGNTSEAEADAEKPADDIDQLTVLLSRLSLDEPGESERG